MWTFGAFKLSFDVNILGHFLQKLGEILFNFLVTLDTELILVKSFIPQAPCHQLFFTLLHFIMASTIKLCVLLLCL
jgi:hypothetical protein